MNSNTAYTRIIYSLFFALLPLVTGTLSFAQDYPSHAIEPVTIEYDVDPTWPNRPDTVAPFGWVSGMAIDDLGHIWVFNRGVDPVQVYTSEGEFVRTWGKGDFSDPHHIRIGPDGNIWVADFGLHIIQKYTPQGELLMTIGVRGEGGNDETHFNKPSDMAVTEKGDIFVTDGYGNRRIVHFDEDGVYVKSWGEYGSGPGQFVLPHAIVADSKGLLYVADRNSGRIQVFDQDGTHKSTWANLIMPWGLSVTQDDTIWVCGSSPHWWVRDGYAPEYKDQILMRFNRDGAVQQIWTLPLGDVGPDNNNPDTSHLKHGETVGVHCIVQDAQGNLYIGDIYGERAQKLVPITTRASSEEQPQVVPQ